MSDDFSRLSRDLALAITPVQTELRKALETVLPSDTGARACGRALGIARTLGWQAWSLAYAPDVASAIGRMPGGPGWKHLLAAIRRAGYPIGEHALLSNAVEDLRMVLVASNATASDLRSMAAGGRSTTTQSTAIRRAMAQSRQAAELLHGVHAGLNAAATLIGPPNGRYRSRFAFVSLFEGLARTRPGPPWAIYNQAFTKSSVRRSGTRSRSSSPSVVPPLQQDLSTPEIADHAVRRSETTNAIEFADAPDRGAAGVRATFLESPRTTVHLPADLEVASAIMTTTVPLRMAIFDLLFHRDRPLIGFATASLFAAGDPIHRLHQDDFPLSTQESCRIPLDRAPEVVAGTSLPTRWRSCDAEYVTAIERAAESIGHELEDFVVVRLELPDPPLHGSIQLHWRWR